MNPIMFILGVLGALIASSGRSDASSLSITPEVEGSSLGAQDAQSTDSVLISDSGTSSDDHTHHDQVYQDITEFGEFHGTSSHTHHDALDGGRTAITTEAHVAYNDLRDFLGLDPVGIEAVGQWAFDNRLTNNEQAWEQDVEGVGLYYAMQGAKVGWIDDEAFDPQILADIQRTARLGETDDVMQMVSAYGLNGFAQYLESNDAVETFVNTLKMEPHYGGWMHGRVHGWLEFDGVNGPETAIAHDLNHLTVLSHDQTEPFMNDTFDWPQWPALDVPQADVANYFQSMVTLGDPKGEGIEEVIEAEASALSTGEALIAALATGEVLDENLPGDSVEEGLEVAF